jgi:hypothetical protein
MDFEEVQEPDQKIGLLGCSSRRTLKFVEK